MKKQFFGSLFCLLAIQAASGMEIQIISGSISGVQRIRPDESLLKKLVKFHEATSSSEYSKKPDMQKLEKTNRCFVAKMDSFGLDRYFSFRTNDDVEELVEAVQQGGGMNVAWYYYDKEMSETAKAAASESPKTKAMEPGVIDISGLDKVEVLRALYAKSKVLDMGRLAFVSGDLDYSEAKEILECQRGYVDYLKGRVMKVDLSRDTLSTRMFNRDNGDGAAEAVIKNLREAKS
jgi:hypothetical protein